MKNGTTPNAIIEKGSNAVLAGIYSLFAWDYGLAFLDTYSFSNLLFFVLESMLVLFFLFRAPPMRISGSVYDWGKVLA